MRLIAIEDSSVVAAVVALEQRLVGFDVEGQARVAFFGSGC